MSIVLPVDGLDTSLSKIIEHALLEIQAIAPGDTIDSTTQDLCVYRFNSLILSLMNEKVPLHSIDTQTITFTSGNDSYTTATNTTKVLSFDDDSYNVINREDYYQMLNESNDGESYVFVDYSNSPATLRFINRGDDGEIIKYQREFTPDKVEYSDDPSFPLQAIEMLILGLASKLAAGYGVPTERRMELKSDYEKTKLMYLSKQTQREGDEIVRPAFIV